jgi:Fe-S-cluster containining protein
VPKVAQLTAGEEILFSRYLGRNDLIDCEEFWADVEKHLNDYNITLPMEYTPQTVRVLQGMLACPPGECGECCRYGITPICQYDVHRLRRVKPLEELQQCIYTRQDGSMYMRGEPAGADCPLLKNNSCSVYDSRPDVCWMFPVQKGPHMAGDTGLIRYRLRCKPAIEVARQVFRGALKGGGHVLLPNLTLIQEAKNGSNTVTDQ